jgi:acetoin:2,6-dichlorophenolindophenol oxidoreductase subunit alpha
MVGEGIMMTANSESLARRAALADRAGQLLRMIEIRLVEERIQKLFSDGKLRGSTHLCNGQEAVAVGIAQSTRCDDTVTCTYRGHGHALALGVTPRDVLGEICGRAVGCAGGVGGSMHLMKPSVGLLPTFAIVGAGLPVACGAAIAARVRKRDSVAIAIFGDGAANIGAAHEALNFAAILHLPVVFVCENNLYGEYTSMEKTTPVEHIAMRAAGYGMPGQVVDGQDLDAVADAMADAVGRARRGEGPSLLEMKTYRYSGHSRSDPAKYRPAGELETWLARDPIDILAKRLIAEGVIAAGERERMRAETSDAVEHVVDEVLAASEPSEKDMLLHVTADSERVSNGIFGED